MSEALLELRGLAKEFTVPGPGWSRLHVCAVDGVDLTLRRGEVYGLVGESGSGKSTLGRLALGLIQPTRGTVVFAGVDVPGARGRAERALRRELQLVFQHPVAALDPRLTVDNIVAEPIRTHRLARGASLRERVGALLDDVGLASALRARYPHELSGGQAQRVVIARALATRPRLLVLDEPTSALDIVIQAQILNLLADLQDEYGLTYLLISHDLSVVRHLSDRIGVMYLGRIIEEGPAEDVFARSRHPYTQALLGSVRGGGRASLDGPPTLGGETPPAWAVPGGCRFHPRCPLRGELGEPVSCSADDPALDGGRAPHRSACHFADRARLEAVPC